MDFTSGTSTDAAKSCLVAALTAGNALDAAERVLGEKDWRSNYWRHFVELNAVCLGSDPATAVRMCEAGLSACRSAFSLGGETLANLEQTGGCSNAAGVFGAEIVRGMRGQQPFTCPLDGRDQTIEQLTGSMAGLVAAGTAEPSVLASLQHLSAQPARLKGEAIDKRFVFAILGACSQMGPTRTLLSLGATVLAIDLHSRDSMWEDLVTFAKASPGRLVVPTRGETPAAARGCDMLVDFSAMSQWIVKTAEQVSPGRRICLGTFLYADGGIFPRLAVAADALAIAVCAARPDTALMSLCSPTECYAVPEEARAEAAKRYAALSVHTPWMRAVETVSAGRYLQRNAPRLVVAAKGDGGDGSGGYLQDSYVWSQGPNYAFAKQIQRWRNLITWWDGGLVSSNVAPASLTVSVMHNKLIRAGMLGCQFFGIMPFEPTTSNALMTALAIHDLFCGPRSAVHGGEGGGHPMDLFIGNAVHGGTWRCAFKTNSYTEVAAAIYALSFATPWVAGVGAVAAATLVTRGRLRSRL